MSKFNLIDYQKIDGSEHIERRLREDEPKEITLKNLSKIIHARVVEIVEQTYVEIRNYGHEEPKKKLIAGIVLTGGGSQLKHIKQLVEYITGMDTRIGYPNEHLAGDSDENFSSPMYATAVGLLIKGLRDIDKNIIKKEENAVDEVSDQDEKSKETPDQTQNDKKSLFEKWSDKFRDFLDNAE